MSRHRLIRNIDIQDELDDDAISDGGGDELSPEQHALMNDGLEQVRLVIGNEEVSELSDNSIKDALWEYYFDAEKTVQWAIDEQQRRHIAKERKGNWNDRTSDSSLDPDHDNEHFQYYPHDHPQYDERIQDYPEQYTHPRGPQIFLAQQQPDFDQAAYMAVESPRPTKRMLSTISEKTERTEPSTLLRSREQHFVPNTPRSFISSPTTTYGHELDDRMSINEQDYYHHPDPNTSRTSPSGSAIERLSKFQAPPSNSSSSTISPYDRFHPSTTSDPVSSFDNLPSIPDLNSKSSNIHEITPPNLPPKKSLSKLSKLATSRASSMSSISASSRSSGTAVTGSIKTFPALRPSAQSERPPSSVSSEVSSKALPPLPSHSEASMPSSTSSLVRRAIATALELEGMDREATPRPHSYQAISITEETDRSKTPTPGDLKQNPDVEEAPKSEVSPQKRPLSKLAKLARQKAESTASSRSAIEFELPSLSPSVSSPSRPMSKLASLAQQKVDSSRVPQLPKTTTEYLTPIANGPTVTTAITTSYQSLYSLTDPSKPNYIPKLNMVPLQSPVTSSPSPSDRKTSKLAMKIKRAGEKPMSPGFPSEEEIVTPPLSPLFQSNANRARASPSAFASVLIHDHVFPQDKSKDKDGKRKKKEHGHKKDKVTTSQIPSDTSMGSHPHRTHKQKKSPESYSSRPFSFDGPSPDDIVLDARRGTALGHKSPTSTSSPRASATTGKSYPSG